MKIKTILTEAVCAATVLFAAQAWALTQYAKVSANGDGNGGGKFYASTSATESTGSYGTSTSTSDTLSQYVVMSLFSGEGEVSGFYLYAFPDFGYKFTGWSQGSSSASVTVSEARTSSLTVTSKSSNKNKPTETAYYAHFTKDDTRVKDIYLCVGDAVKLNFYNTTSRSWSARVNSTFLGTTTTTSSSYASYAFSAGDTTAASAFDVTITASASTGSGYDELSVLDYAGNVYHYRVHVSAARTMYERASLDLTATSFASAEWTVTVDSGHKLTASPTSGSAASSFATQVTAATNVSGSATLEVDNYDGQQTTGARGVEYSYAFTINELPKYAHYAKVTANVADSGGKAYVALSSSEATGSYVASETSASTSAQSKEIWTDVGNFWLFAFPEFGYKCTGWGKETSSAAVSLAFARNTTAIKVSSNASSESSPVTEKYFAHFSSSGVTVKDVYLAVGDKVQLYFYNSATAPWSARVNSTWLTSTSATGGSYASCKRSVANATASQKFNLTVTATTASGTNYDQLTVQDCEGNVYHYRVHVTAAREMRRGRTETATLNAFYSQSWYVSESSDASTFSGRVTSSAASDSVSIVLSALKASDTTETVTVGNYTDNATTGPQGAVYTLQATISDPPSNTFYARVDTAVVGASAGSIGAGWAYASNKRTEDSDVYQTTVSHSELGSVSVYEDEGDSGSVGGFYLFAFPNLGYKFTGWSKNDPNGAIVSTVAFHMDPVSVTSESTDKDNPAVDTYYAHFAKDDATVRDITLAVGDSVRVSWYNEKADNWSLQVVYMNGSEEVVVNLDDTAAHAGGYANYTRSASVSTDSNEFSMLVEATKASGDDYDQLTIEDYAGNVYHYRVHVVDRRVVEQHETITFPATSFASKAWSRSGIDELALTASVSPGAPTNAATVHVTGVAKSATTFNISNYSSGTATGALGASYTFAMSVIEPWPVEFCQGDEVVIYYHNTTAKNWYLLINGQRVEPNVPGKGTQMTVTLTADNPDTDTEILGLTTTVGDGTSSDLVVVTDGENFYPYRMSVKPRRVLEIGETASMTCSTVATSPWRYQVSSAASQYLETSFDLDVNGGHSATAHLTGKAPGKNAKVYVANFKRDDASVNAQGAYYTLVTDVIGASTRGVYMSLGTEVTWGENYIDYADGMTFAATPAVSNAMTAVVASNVSATVFTTLAVPTNATKFTKALFTVRDNNSADVVKYDVMAYSWMSMAVGQEAPGCLDGSSVPWVVHSSDPEKFSAEPTLYNELNSARVVALAPGDFTLWATNASDKVKWYVIRAKVYDETERYVSLPLGGTTNLTIAAAEGLESLWSVTTGCSHVTATLDNETTPTNSVTLAIAGGTSEGTHKITVTGDYHHETITVYVGASAEQQVVYAGAVTSTVPNKVTLPADCVTAAWTASVAESGAAYFHLLKTSGAAGESAQIQCDKPGTGQVMVKNDSTIYVYDVIIEKTSGSLVPSITVGVGYTVVTNLTALSPLLTGATLAKSPDSLTATAYLAGETLTVNGVQDGTTTIQLATEDYIYTVEIIVHQRRIVKNITLYVGEDGTATSYSYTFDQLLSYENKNEDRVTVTTSGTTVTLTPKPSAEGIAEVDVECFVDGLSESSTLIYAITIVQEKSGYQVRDFDEGHVAYRGADVVREESGDLVFVFTNVNVGGSVSIPDGYSARCDILAVGGGGGGGSVATGFGRGGGGGGAGGFASITNKKMVAGTFGVSVGAGGLGLSSQFGNESLPGSNGGASIITNSYGYVIVCGNGGGGGAAPSSNAYSGLDGGSGGGGTWISTNDVNGTTIWIPGRGGLGIDGQGCEGGTPTSEKNRGGGGGGAGGNGGSGLIEGPGKSSDISGETIEYSRGGRGGRDDSEEVAANGAGPGWGGGGGNGGPGGDGANGAVIIRFKKLYQNVLVPVPTTNDLITARFEWAEGETYAPFQYEGRSFRSSSNAHPYDWEDVIKNITGTTNVVCEYDESGTNKLGIGYYNFRIELNDGFAWEDGSSYGSLEKLSYRWVVVENWEDIDADIAINKTVWWSDKSNATIRVNSIASPETTGGGVPNVLFLGTLCGAHGLNSSVINSALNAITAVGNVDCYLFNSTTEIAIDSGADIHHEDGPYFTTNLVKGMTIDYAFKAKSGYSGDVYSLEDTTHVTGNHDSMLGFYRQIYANITNANPKVYDYVIFSFDRTRLAERFDLAFEHEAVVAAWLKPFYADEKVIWLVDNDPVTVTAGSTSVTTFPWFPANLTYYNSGETLDVGVYYWRSSSSVCSQWVSDEEYAYVPYNALVGLMCPSNYPVNKTTYMANVMPTKSDMTYAKVMATACAGIDAQCAYDDADEVAAFVASKVKVKPYNIYYKDKIVSPAEGLTIQDVTIKVCTTGDGETASTNETDWVDLMHWSVGMADDEFIYDDVTHASGIPGASMNVDTVSNLVTACLSNIDFKVWVRYDTHVLDAEGKFQTSDGANYNESTGQYEKNPNEGTAYITMINELGVGIGVEGDAETEVPWRYTAYEIVGTAQNGSIYVAGTQYSTLSCAEGRDVTVYYRGNGGYRLSALKVDGNDVQIGGEYDHSYTFRNLQTDHKVAAVYTAYYGTVTPCGVTNEYDGAAHVPNVILEGWDATYSTEVRYSLSNEGPYYTEAEFIELYSTNREITCVGDHTVYCRVYALQPGYGETLDESGWVWVDTRVLEPGIVTITKKPLVVTANSFKLSASEAPKNPPLDQWASVTVSGLVAGDTVNTNDAYLTWSCPDYQYEVGQYRVDPVLQTDVTEFDVVGTNYVLYLRPGVVSVIRSPMVIGDVTQFSGLDPEDPHTDTGVDRVVKDYDGVATNLVIEINDPTGDKAERLVFKYSTDDGKTWTTTLPTQMHAGTNKVWYVIEDGTSETDALYFSVTNYNYIIVNPRPLELTAASATKRYDTLPLTTNRYDITSGSLADGDRIFRSSVSGSQTDVGTSANVVSGVRVRNDEHAEERTSDYAITYVDGALTVTPGAITIGEKTYEPGAYVPYGETGVEDAVKVYDGIGTNISVNVVTPARGSTVRYTTNTTHDAEMVWTDEIAFTNAGTYTVYFEVEADNYATVTNFAKVVITPRPLTVTVLDTLVRKGKTPVYSSVVTYSDTGEVVPQEVLDQLEYDIGPTNSAWATELGDYDIVATGDAVQGNYSLTYVPGTLTVHDKTEIEFDAPNVTEVYNGGGHSNLVTVTTEGVPGLEVLYSLSSDGPWSTTPPVVTNTTSGTTVYYQVNSSDDTYLDYSGVMILTVNPYPITITANDAWKWENDDNPAFTATVTGLIGDDDPNQFTYTFSADGMTPGTYPITPSGDAVQGNYKITYADGTLEVREWLFPVGPHDELIPIDKDWIETMGPYEETVKYIVASNYVLTPGQNGMTNWMSYVLGLEPTNINSVVYLDIEPNLAAVEQPTFVTRGATVRTMPLGTLTGVVFRLTKSTSPTGTYEKVSDTADGRFPQGNVPTQYFKVNTIFQFEEATE